MKILFRLRMFVSMLALGSALGLLALVALPVLAQTDPAVSAGTAQALEGLTPMVIKFALQYPVLASVLLVIGSLRFLVKPVVAGVHWYAEQTESPKDDELIARIENSAWLKVVLFVLDWLGSVKVRR